MRLLLQRAFFTLSLLTVGQAFAGKYIVRQGDTLSQIALLTIGMPVYGDGGSLGKLMAFNPQIDDVNVIHVGQLLETGTDGVPALRLGSQIEEEKDDQEIAKVAQNLQQRLDGGDGTGPRAPGSVVPDKSEKLAEDAPHQKDGVAPRKPLKSKRPHDPIKHAY